MSAQAVEPSQEPTTRAPFLGRTTAAASKTRSAAYSTHRLAVICPGAEEGYPSHASRTASLESLPDSACRLDVAPPSAIDCTRNRRPGECDEAEPVGEARFSLLPRLGDVLSRTLLASPSGFSRFSQRPLPPETRFFVCRHLCRPLSPPRRSRGDPSFFGRRWQCPCRRY